MTAGGKALAVRGFSAHTTAKSGLDGFVKSLVTELDPHGIRVNAILLVSNKNGVLESIDGWSSTKPKNSV